MIRIEWSLEISVWPAKGSAEAEDGQEARRVIQDALQAHLTGIFDEQERAELSADLLPRVGVWIVRAAESRKPQRYTAPGVSVRVARVVVPST